MDFLDFREPIEYVVDNWFKRKKLNELNINGETGMTRMSGGDSTDDSLPETPCHFIRDEEGQLTKIIYGNAAALESEEEEYITIWQEEFIYNQTGELEKITTTYPDGETADTVIIYENGEVVGIE